VCSLYKGTLSVTTGKQIFIGSSGSPISLKICDCVHHCLDRSGFLPYIWQDDLFASSKSNLDNILQLLKRFTAAVFVFSPEDKILLGKQEFLTVRDNVLFESGLFIGKLGSNRVFILFPDSKISSARIPTDLAGISFILYNDERLEQESDWLAVLAPRIRMQIADRLRKEFGNTTNA
jgi:predicted nucleotide-binding protein